MVDILWQSKIPRTIEITRVKLQALITIKNAHRFLLRYGHKFKILQDQEVRQTRLPMLEMFPSPSAFSSTCAGGPPDHILKRHDCWEGIQERRRKFQFSVKNCQIIRNFKLLKFNRDLNQIQKEQRFFLECLRIFFKCQKKVSGFLILPQNTKEI